MWGAKALAAAGKGADSELEGIEYAPKEALINSAFRPLRLRNLLIFKGVDAKRQDSCRINLF